MHVFENPGGALMLKSVVETSARFAAIPDTCPVTGMGVDVASVAKAIRNAAPQCVIIDYDIQHAAHGGTRCVDLNDSEFGFRT